MWYKAKPGDENLILNYCSKEPALNTFIIADLENFGLSNQFQDLWYEMTEGKPIGVVLRYYKTLICYSYNNISDFNIIDELLLKHDIDFIQGKLDLLKDLKIEGDLTNLRLMHLVNDSHTQNQNDAICIATLDDALSISKAYGDYPHLLAAYSSDLNERTDQIRKRIETKEGIHAFIKDGEKILAHGNTTAENSFSTMIGGIFATDSNDIYGILSFLTQYALEKSLVPCLFMNQEQLLAPSIELGYEFLSDWGIIRRT